MKERKIPRNAENNLVSSLKIPEQKPSRSRGAVVLPVMCLFMGGEYHVFDKRDEQSPGSRFCKYVYIGATRDREDMQKTMLELSRQYH